MLHFRQPYVRSTGLFKESPHIFRVTSSRANKADHHGYTAKQLRIRYFFVIHLFILLLVVLLLFLLFWLVNGLHPSPELI